jgi:mannose-1-phosphate guanylyltransferase
VRALLLAAGEGRRLRPLTDRVPKCLVPIGGTPLLGIWLQQLEAHGVRAVLVNTHHLARDVEAFLRSWPTTMDVVTAHEPRLLGSAGTVLANRDFVADGEPFLIIYADNLSNLDLGKMARFHATHREPLTMGIVPTDRPREKGTVLVDSVGRVVAFEEKADHPRSNLSNAGVYVASADLFDDLRAAGPADVLDFGHDILPRLVPRIIAYPIDEFMTDIGTPEAYARAQLVWQAMQASPRTGDAGGAGAHRPGPRSSQ